MRKRIVVLHLIIAISSLVGSTQASAQSIRSAYRFLDTKQAFTGYAGYLATGKGSLELGPAAGPIYGLRYDISISGPFAIEGDVGYFSRTRMVWDTVPGDTTRKVVGEADFTTFLVTAALRFNLTGPRTYHGLLPYVVFGLGVAIDGSNASTADANLAADARFDFGTSFMGVLGGGLEATLSNHFGLRFDARNLLWKLKTPTAFLVKGDQARLLPGDEWAQNFALTGGLVFRF
jgi:Outer membrane protein beta-barrel domain